MRKLTPKRKQHLATRARYQLRRSRWASGKVHRKSRSKKFKRTRPPNWESVVAPPTFNLKHENVESAISYIEEVKKLGREKKDVNFLLENVKDIGVGAISMLISVMQELENKNIYFKGKLPVDEKARSTIEQSGFLDYVRVENLPKTKNAENIIFTTGKSYTHQHVLVNVIRRTNNAVWRENGRSPLLYGAMLEMIKNSCKHAFLSDENVRWHIALNHEAEEKIVRFSFVDNGIGIIKSFEKDSLSRKARGLIRNNSEMIKLAFENGIESKTGLPWRGTGLPTIHETFAVDGIVKQLVVITNDVYCDFGQGIYENLSESYSGTYYYWEIDSSCVKHCFTES